MTVQGVDYQCVAERMPNITKGMVKEEEICIKNGIGCIISLEI